MTSTKRAMQLARVADRAQRRADRIKRAETWLALKAAGVGAGIMLAWLAFWTW